MTSPLIHDVPRVQRVNRLLQQGLALPQAEREIWLTRIADEQADLMPLIRALLTRATTESDAFMARPVDSVWAEAIGDTGGIRPGEQVGPYRLVRELGSGGMGTVWLAARADGVLRRQVALKLPRFGWAPGVAERLQQERDALATLEHRHIARLYDAGMTAEGRPYLAMEFVDGSPIDVFRERVGPAEVLTSRPCCSASGIRAPLPYSAGLVPSLLSHPKDFMSLS